MFLMVSVIKKNWKSNFKKLKSKVFAFVQIYVQDLLSVCRNSEKWSVSQLMTGEYYFENTVVKYWNVIVPGYIHATFIPFGLQIA